jgi:hypothetical protein
MVRAIVRRKAWLIEGGYYSAFEYTYDAADIVIFLQPSFGARLWNTVARFFRRIAAGKYEGFSNFVELFSYNVRTRNKWPERVQVFRKLYGDKLHVFANADEAYKWFVQTYRTTAA